MRLYAVTYTDDSEPWGADVCNNTLYVTREAAEAALEARFESYGGRWGREDFDRTYAIGEYTVEGLIDPDRGSLQGTV